jgi:hypothetical protein
VERASEFSLPAGEKKVAPLLVTAGVVSDVA